MSVRLEKPVPASTSDGPQSVLQPAHIYSVEDDSNANKIAKTQGSNKNEDEDDDDKSEEDDIEDGNDDDKEGTPRYSQPSYPLPRTSYYQPSFPKESYPRTPGSTRRSVEIGEEWHPPTASDLNISHHGPQKYDDPGPEEREKDRMETSATNLGDVD